MMSKRTLTVTFERLISANTPSVLEVTVVPLANPVADMILFGGPQTQTVTVFNDAESVTFDLIPSDQEDSEEPLVVYRIAWRDQYLGRQYTADFTMPDEDADFAALGDRIVDGPHS